MKWVRKHASFANVASLMALMVALSGTAVAATSLARNSVGTGQLKKGAVRTSDIRKGAVTSSKVKNRTLKAADFAPGTLTAGPARARRAARRGRRARGADGPSGADAGTADRFARVQANGTLQPDVDGFPSQVKGSWPRAWSRVRGEPPTGTYCFDLPARATSAMVSLDNADAAAADRNLITSVALFRGEDLGDCPATHNDARVRIVDGNTAAAQDARFFVWFEE